MKIVEKKYILPFCLVTALFLLWGIAANMTDTLLSAFRKIMSMSDLQTSLIQFAFYGSYFCFALPAALYIRRFSYKSGIILGLLLYSAGSILFFPAAKTASYAFYLVAIYIMAGGCSILETTANPYILSMGSPDTATRRLNIAQSFNPIGCITGILLSKYFILKDISLGSISGTYMSLGFALLGILLVMILSNMPEGKDTDSSESIKSVFSRLFKRKEYVFGVIALFFYMGAQTGVWSYSIRLSMSELGCTESQGATIYLIAVICFSVARFIFTWLMKWFKDSRLLAFSAAAGAVLSVVVTLASGSGWICVAAMTMISFFMSLMFPTIYGISLADIESPSAGGMKGDAKIAASGLIMAILGGAVITPLQGLISDLAGINISFVVPVFCFIVVLVFAAYSDRSR